MNAKVSKQLRELGANYDHRIKGFRLSLDKLPMDLHLAIVQSKSNATNLAKEILSKIDNLHYQDNLDY